MAKFDLDSLSIEELAKLRESATEKLMEKVAARQAELEAELEKLAQYRPIKKAVAAVPTSKQRKSEDKKIDEPKDAVAKAA
ncbi:MAG: hypothetical protein HY852_07740 [Bradyrhizobium sp.]|uniref:hypothetical protein n=1 Tax=Bradyrhizobium sp. TaxID=376 RepID=UPI0025C423E7|nr:hypothetical protein [Bradyrhizobium sp.]MBI5261694.1 hypothetical protein [Bradyrhizobium sp.]